MIFAEFYPPLIFSIVRLTTDGLDTHRADFIVPRRDLREHVREPLPLRLYGRDEISHHDAIDARPVLARAHREVRHDVALRPRVQARPMAQRTILDIDHALERLLPRVIAVVAVLRFAAGTGAGA